MAGVTDGQYDSECRHEGSSRRHRRSSAFWRRWCGRRGVCVCRWVQGGSDPGGCSGPGAHARHLPRLHQHPDADGHVYAKYRDADFDEHAHRHPDRHTDGYPDQHTDGYADADPDQHTDGHAHPDPDEHADQHADQHAATNADWYLWTQ
jgi:hypothetical protein